MKWTNEELRPCLGDSLAYDGQSTEDTTEEQSAATSEVVIKGIREPGSNKTDAKVRSARHGQFFFVA